MPNRLDLLLLSDEAALQTERRVDRHRRVGPREAMLARAYQRIGLSPVEAGEVERRLGGIPLFAPYPNGTMGISLPHRPSLALADLATVCAERGYEVRVVDNFLRWPERMQQVEELCRDDSPSLIGLSTTFMFDPEAVRRTVALLRELSPSSKIVLGGPSVRRLTELHGCADFAVFGSGEDSLLAVLDALKGGRSIESVPRIAYRGDGGDLRYGPEGEAAAQLGKIGQPYRTLQDEQIPVPDWTLYRRSPEQVYPIELSRGCKYNCYYCSFDRGKSVRSLGDVREELLRNARLGIRKYRVSDANFTDGPPGRPRYPHEVCEAMIELDLGLQWSCFARVDDMTPELADLMRRAGCYCVFFGVESGDDEVLRLMRKGHDSADAARGIGIARQAGLLTHANFMVGYPGDSVAANERTLEFIERHRPDSVLVQQYFAEAPSPVMGGRMKQFRLEGAGCNWKHATMDSGQAAELVQSDVERILKAGIVMGSDFEAAVYLSLGLTLEETRQYQRDVNLLQDDDDPSEGARCEAAGRVRHMMLHRFPLAIALDRHAMGLS